MSWIDRLRQKPDNEKKVIAFWLALSITFVIAVVWFLARSAMQSV